MMGDKDITCDDNVTLFDIINNMDFIPNLMACIGYMSESFQTSSCFKKNRILRKQGKMVIYDSFIA